MQYKLRSGALLQDVAAAPGMLRRGKLPLRPPRIEGVDEVRRIFEARLRAAQRRRAGADEARRMPTARLLPRLLDARHLARVSRRACTAIAARARHRHDRDRRLELLRRQLGARRPTICSAWRCRRATWRWPRRRASTKCSRPARPATAGSGGRRATRSPTSTAWPSRFPSCCDRPFANSVARAQHRRVPAAA